MVSLVGRNLNRLVSSKVRSRVTQRCPRKDCIGTAGQADTTVGLVLTRGREIPCSTKVELYQEQTRDKVRRRFTLLVTAQVGGTTGQTPTLLVVLAAVVVRDSSK